MDGNIPSGMSPSKRPLIIGLALALVTLFVFWPAKDFEFLGYDDQGYFYENPHVLAGLTPAGIVWAFSSGEAANWHPLTWISLMLDAQIFGPGPTGPHLVNILFHAANTVLLFVILRRLTNVLWRSALVAALFALHPMHVESVAWVAERKDVLSLFFELLALLAYVRAAGEMALPSTSASGGLLSSVKLPSEPGWKKFLPALVFFALALMSKPMAVTFPCLLLLLDLWPLKRAGIGVANLLREKIPFFALTLVVCVITFIVQRHGGTVQSLEDYSLGVRVENALVSYARYLAKLFWPVNLANPYPHPGHWPMALVIGSAGLLAFVSVAAWFARKISPWVLVGWCWFLGTLVPVIGIVQVGDQAMADRYSYLPYIGVFLALVWGAAELFSRFKIPAPVSAIVALLLLVGCLFSTQAQLQFWRNDGTLFGHALAVTEKNFTAEINLGAWLSKQGAPDQALLCYSRALQLKPTNAVALYDVGNIFTRMGNWTEAEPRYCAALRSRPDYPEALNNLGLVLMRQKRFEEASTNLLTALRLRPDFSDAHNNFATLCFYQGRHEDSARSFARALELAPENPIYAMNAGDAFARIGQLQLAANCYQHALQLQPGNEKARAKLAALAASASVPQPK
jgi:Tfp pilus assembly protein PilF